MSEPSNSQPPNGQIIAGELTVPTRPRADERRSLVWWLKRISWSKLLLFALSTTLFILAILLMKESARGLAPLVRDTFAVDTPLRGLGFGWISAYIVMSGSPVAAAALAFYEGGLTDQLVTYHMITGSRLGAGFIVLFIGFIYVVRGRDPSTNLGMGLLTLAVTGSMYLVALPLGALLLQSEFLAGWSTPSASLAHSITDFIFTPAVSLIEHSFPPWIQFLIGIGIIMVSFNLFDRCLPQMTLRESPLGRPSRLVYRPPVMFLLGAAITLISMSVSVSLGILLPLSNRGFIRRENIVPYIMGANITTFIDTLFASLLLENPGGFIIVLAQMISITATSILLLLFGFRQYERGLLALVNRVTSQKVIMAAVMVLVFALPVVLLLI